MVSGLVAAVLLFGSVVVGCDATGGSDSSRSATSTSSHTVSAEDVETTFPATQRQPFKAPPELRSMDGVLDATFTVKETSFDVAGTSVKGLPVLEVGVSDSR